MKICILADARSYHTQRWVDYFVVQGHPTYLLSVRPGLKTKAEEFIFSPKSPLQFFKYIEVVPQAKKIIKELNPDLVNAHFIPADGLIAALTGFKPLVITTLGSDALISPRKSILHRLRAKYVLSKADLVTCDSDVVLNNLVNLGVDGNKIVKAFFGVDRKLLCIGEKRKFAKKEELVILSNRRFEPVYNVETLIRAIPLILEKTKRKLKFIILGKGSEENKLRNLAERLNIKNEIEFMGEIEKEKLWESYSQADLYVSTSLSDSTSVSLLEAMAAGLIPVVTDIQGNREWIEENANGFLFPKRDYQTLARKILFLVEHFSEWNSLGKRNCSLIKAKGIWEDNMKIIENKFQELLNR
jgi:glycosyltransferase involved in cell wall biosynthesis